MILTRTKFHSLDFYTVSSDPSNHHVDQSIKLYLRDWKFSDVLTSETVFEYRLCQWFRFTKRCQVYRKK
ncbi:hypothetical protein T06_2689 [Trichinella sp. T6]|nr:hypothetical protein T06_2689 [Trichinella sp. T6]